MASREVDLRTKIEILRSLVAFKPRLQIAIVSVALFTAVFEGIGLSFLLPIIEVAQSGEAITNADGNQLLAAFLSVADLIGVQLTLETTMIGLTVIMFLRFTAQFVLRWFRSVLKTSYTAHLRSRAFDRSMDAETAYFDEHGSDEILNTIITETQNVAPLVKQFVNLIHLLLMIGAYLSVVILISPVLSVVSLLLLGVVTAIARILLEPAFDIGNRVVDANQRVQTVTQDSIQGVRGIKLYGLFEHMKERYEDALDQFVDDQVKLAKNEAIFSNYYQFASIGTVFLIIYLSLEFFSLPLSSLSVLLFAMYRLAPKVSNLNNQVYSLDGKLPHHHNIDRLLDELEERREKKGGERPVPEPVEEVRFEEVTFGYGDETVVKDISFSVERGESVAFVGESGTGKSTIVSLLTRLYEVDDGDIRINGIDITAFDLSDLRDHIAVVPQNPYIFNESIRYNIALGDESISQEEIEHACHLAGINVFLDELANGYETLLGEEGVRLSGGQRQRVAIARALLKDADTLVLDEATSELDRNLEKQIYEELRSLKDEYLLLSISHKQSAVQDADRIYTMKDGEIRQTGTHHELIDRDGVYSQLYQGQQY